MIFLIVDGAKKLRWKRAEARQEVHMLCSRTIKETLRVMPEGYLCREQPGDLKYMVCFSSPKVRGWANDVAHMIAPSVRADLYMPRHGG